MLLALCLFTLSTGCVSVRGAVTRPKMPAVVASTDVDSLYEAHKLVCAEGRCDRGGEAFEAGKLVATAYGPAASLVAIHAFQRDTIVYSLFGASAVAAFLAMDQATNAPQFRDKDTIKASIGLAATSALAGALVRILWPEASEAFAEEYNRALREDIESRVKDPASVAQK